MKLVNLSEVINEIEKFKGYLDEDMIWRIKFAINRLPITDAEPVIRCKDCYFCGEIDEDGWHWCQCTGADMPKDGFCPHAVRKRMERGNKNEMDKC